MSHERPKAVILGGQPGAGKGGLAAVAREELSGDVVTVDPDQLRDYHPDVESLRAQYPCTWSGHVHADAGQWADELRQAVVAGRRNFIFDTTLSNGSWSSQLIRELQTKGYDVEVRVAASPRLESELGVDKRFADKIDVEGCGRYVPQGVRDHVLEQLPKSLDTIHDETDVPIRILDREGQELYDSRVDERSPGQALADAHQVRMHDPDVVDRLHQGWQEQCSWHENLPRSLADNSKVTPDMADRLLAERDAEHVVQGVQGNAARVAGVHAAMHGLGLPAARMSDMHVCPMTTGPVPHVGGPIAVGCPHVLVGGLAAACVGDMATCVGPPDTVAKGSAKVLVGGRPAARLGDSSIHGGVIVAGCPSVLTS